MIYVRHGQDKLVRVEYGCGLFPLKGDNCPVIAHAYENYDPVIRHLGAPWKPTAIVICPDANTDLDELNMTINKACDECRYGEAMRIRRRSK